MKKREQNRCEKNKPKECCVLLWEEYGCRVFIWYPEMTAQELIEWWKNLDWCPSVDDLPGRVIKVKSGKRQRYLDIEKSGEAFWGHIHMEDDNYLKTPQGEMIFHKGRVARAAEEEKRRRTRR